MSEYQVSYFHTYSIDSVYPYSLDIPEIITQISREILRNATHLIRLIKLLQKEGEPFKNYEEKIIRLVYKLQNQFYLLESHRKSDQEEYDALSLELNSAILEKDTLLIKRKIKEIDDEEYAIKLSVANWEIEDKIAKKAVLKNSLRAIDEFKGLVVISDINDLYQISKNDFHSLIDLDLDAYICEALVCVFNKILETIRYSNPSTL